VARENISMTTDELRSFLGSVEWVALGTLDEHGGPAASLAAAVMKQDRLFFVVAEESPAATHLSRDPRCCCTADIFPTYNQIKGATIHGHAQRSTDDHVVIAELARRAKAHGLADGIVYALPLLEDAFGFDFAKLTPI
jgi:hypothetical protein